MLDTDTDGSFNHLDLDSDGDNKFDLVEAGGTDNNGDGQVDAWLDSDADGIPDEIDADQVVGNDEDGDGIIDQADADMVNEPDTDGDGIVDSFDRDPFDTGYIRFNDETLTADTLPDTNANNIPDVFENTTTLEPVAAAAMPEGYIVTGLSGSGCSIESANTEWDPLMMMMMFIASGWLFITRGKRQLALYLRKGN